MRAVVALALALAACGASAQKQMTVTVADIRRADYQADLEALRRDEQALAPHASDPALAAAVSYWRGFALWRRALNLMNVPSFDKAAALADLREAVGDFERIGDGPLAADGKSAAAGCLMSVAYLLGMTDPETRNILPKFIGLMKEAVALGPKNPRVLWVYGGQKLYTPPQFGGGRDAAFATYEQGLAEARAAVPPADPLVPAWGEAEILMAMAYAESTVPPSDLARAEKLARDALALRPDWHYVRDILLPGILEKSRAARP